MWNVEVGLSSLSHVVSIPGSFESTRPPYGATKDSGNYHPDKATTNHSLTCSDVSTPYRCKHLLQTATGWRATMHQLFPSPCAYPYIYICFTKNLQFVLVLVTGEGQHLLITYKPPTTSYSFRPTGATRKEISNLTHHEVMMDHEAPYNVAGATNELLLWDWAGRGIKLGDRPASLASNV
ncbi:hypothetical protein CCM_02894 [Cordyceps militaris CM01]|uniref:Uncharacterized protein n=1 Tax=Cordyceps militaris (strain CM01) TaxID=983644 RepID=G3JCG2_CORMM|nr:uncharacterized protein CCM_02894 [Cordyceps militaris CM01]EGX94623.1 hypothetical protein CCM_02894 [Cordyceps militaris CM01]